MNVKSVEKQEKSTVELVIEIGKEEFEAAVEKVYKKQRGKISVPGFRKGKAPRKIIEGMYGSGVFYEDAINDVYPGAYEAAVKEQGLEDMGHPVMDIVEGGKDGLTFTALVSVRPEVKLGEYKGLTAEKAEVAISDEDVDNEFARAGIKDVKSTVAQWKKEGRLPAIRDSIRRTKALDWLVENAKVNVVDEVAERASEGEKDDEAADAE